MPKKAGTIGLKHPVEFAPLMDSIEHVIKTLKGGTLRERIVLDELKLKYKIYAACCCKIAHVVPYDPHDPAPGDVSLQPAKAARSKKR